jgi:cyclophilin family peptidyl-prolyl cis-trans isomerase
VIAMARSINQSEAKEKLQQFRAQGASEAALEPLKQIAADPQAGWSGSQFYICQAPADNPRLQYLNGRYTAFGKLIKGEAVLEKIAATPVTASAQGEPSKPTARVDVISIKIVPADAVK